MEKSGMRRDMKMMAVMRRNNINFLSHRVSLKLFILGKTLCTRFWQILLCGNMMYIYILEKAIFHIDLGGGFICCPM